MNIFEYYSNLIKDYSEYVRSFIQIRDKKIVDFVDEKLTNGQYWPEPLIHLNPTFESGGYIDELVNKGIIHQECKHIFRKDKGPASNGEPLNLHKHQREAIECSSRGENYVLTTGTGSGKSLSYIVPIVDHVLRIGSGKGIQAIIVYPMNALANSQFGELEKFLNFGYPNQQGPVTFKKYTGQESDEEKREIISNPPDILITNYVMLELILTRVHDKKLIEAARNVRFLVFDELHTYRGRQGSDVAMLIRRVRQYCDDSKLQCVGTSATMASEGTLDEQRAEVAKVATLLFGKKVKPECIIGETLKRATVSRNEFADFGQSLKERVQDLSFQAETYEEFVRDPLAVWVEDTFGLSYEPGTKRLIRSTPRSIYGEDGAARELSTVTNTPIEQCIGVIQQTLLAGYQHRNPVTGFPLFAFRLHAFISRGDSVYASLEKEDKRYLTLEGQRYVPNDRSKILLPLAFCRECGQGYYTVKLTTSRESRKVVTGREVSDMDVDDELGEKAGFLYFNSDNPWPEDLDEMIQRLPENWIDDARGTVQKTYQRWLPTSIYLSTEGEESIDDDATEFQFFDAPFHFCLNCGVSYSANNGSDFAKLGTLGSEGRSTATTVLSLSAVRYLRKESGLPQRAKKLLSFTDNRQDASLQAGHFNDFVEVGLLRSALYRAVSQSPFGLRHHEIALKVFDALDLPPALYSSSPDARFNIRANIEEAFRNVLGYRLYRDLRRGWRITSPNLEQCGLLRIDYEALEELCHAKDEDIWPLCHSALSSALPETRQAVLKVFLDVMRRELAIKVPYLNRQYQEGIKLQSSTSLIEPWRIDDNEQLESSRILFPRTKSKGTDRNQLFVSERSGFGKYVRRRTTFHDYHEKLTLKDTEQIIRDIIRVLVIAGLVEKVAEDEQGIPGYQLNSAGMIWSVSDGTKPFHDPIRVPKSSDLGGRTNPFFVSFYREMAFDAIGIYAKEHTAQVQNTERLKREQEFRAAELPILYCSPTMELGVDISELNVVNMRNVPPTPANYAQRSGRAGRSGQPALVFTYCSMGSPHDQYFFKHPQLMVKGAVNPPRIDMKNEELISSHIQAIWLEEAGLDLGKTLKDVLDLSTETLELDLLPSVHAVLQNMEVRRRTFERAKAIVDGLNNDFGDFDDEAIRGILNQIMLTFTEACDRWRNLYRSAVRQIENQTRIIMDASRPVEDKKQAKRLRSEAEAQQALLTESENIVQSDFYSYRYFASEGFLPGYNFTRLPLSAYIPGKRQRKGDDEFLSRPRFLALSEFGPRSIVYHEGSRYEINKVILPLGEGESREEVLTRSAKVCSNCGYVHPMVDVVGPDVCEHCSQPLQGPITNLFRMQNVTARRRDRINSDEEERLRQGYEIKTVIRFAEKGHNQPSQVAEVKEQGVTIARLFYGHTATLWRINLGRSRRKEKERHGFELDIERGYWAKSDSFNDDVIQDPMSHRTMRVIPYVEDRRNCLLLEPNIILDDAEMASLQSALKQAIQIVYQLEDNELAAEPLPDAEDRKKILFYESSEGGAGVLRHLVEVQGALALVAREALRLCHFDPDTGEDLRRAPSAKEDCEAACYYCLMNYGNQRDHELLDRQLIREVLLSLKQSLTESSPTGIGRGDHFTSLMNSTDSELERDWLRFIQANGLNLPSIAQKMVESCNTRPDFLYEQEQVAVYIDGPAHDYPERQARDMTQTICMENKGYIVVRFGHREDWNQIVQEHSYVFGGP